MKIKTTAGQTLSLNRIVSPFEVAAIFRQQPRVMCVQTLIGYYLRPK